ncbi:hypothetical protein [Verrucomicrobium spinosum]|uniref:hypothetical protein n=1 Tax=Verrucomicrobium spinosum TaxID=2736 RepID=UPI000A8DF260|nr:hypothetical protein [Verrucomicrobium spinosum]
MGDGRRYRDPNYMIFSDRNCNYPQAKFGLWWLTQLRRWGFTPGAPDYAAVTQQVMRGDIYEEAMKEIATPTAGPTTSRRASSTEASLIPRRPGGVCRQLCIKSLKA